MKPKSVLEQLANQYTLPGGAFYMDEQGTIQTVETIADLKKYLMIKGATQVIYVKAIDRFVESDSSGVADEVTSWASTHPKRKGYRWVLQEPDASAFIADNAAEIAAVIPDATTSVAGKMSASDKAKLDTIQAGATASVGDDKFPLKEAANELRYLGPIYVCRQPITYTTDKLSVCVPIVGKYFAEYKFQALSTGVNTLRWFSVSMPFTWVSVNSGSVTKSGTWTVGVQAAARGGYSGYSTTAGDYVEATVTGSKVGAFRYTSTNGGYALVTIDGSGTLANRLPVVTQSLVDGGFFAAGDLGKTYIDTWCISLDPDRWTIFADNLTDAAHVVRITAKGTKRAASSAARCYVSAIAASSLATSMTDSNTGPAAVQQIYTLDSEATLNTGRAFASVCALASIAGDHFVGEIHGNETQSSWTILIDGAAVTPAVGSVAAARTVHLSRVTVIDSTRATKVSSFSFSDVRPGQCQMETTYGWLGSETVNIIYSGMLPCLDRDGAEAKVMPLPFGIADNTVESFVADNGVTLGGEHRILGYCSTTKPWVPWLASDPQSNRYTTGENAAFFQDYTSDGPKAYFSQTTSPRSVVAGDVDVVRATIGVEYFPSIATHITSLVDSGTADKTKLDAIDLAALKFILPTSTAGLSPGMLWNNAGSVTIYAP